MMENNEVVRRYEDWPLNRAKQSLFIYALTENEENYAEVREKILNCLHTGNADVSVFAEKRELLYKMSELLKTGDSVLLLAESEQFLSLKETLMRALALPVGIDEELSARLQKSGKDKQFANMPRGAKVFMTDDGVNSGFAVRAGKQIIILLPLDNERADGLLNAGARSYLETFGEDITAVNGAKHHSSDPVQRASRALQRVGKRAAVAGTPAAAFVKELISSDEAGIAQENFAFSENAQPRGEYAPRDYAVLLAENAMEEAGASLGIAVTNVFAKNREEMDGLFVCIAVTTEDKAAGRTLYANPGENPVDFLKSAAAELLNLLSEVTEAMPTIAMTSPVVPIYNKPEEKQPKQKKSSSLWIAAVLLIAVILAVVLGLKFSGYFDIPEENNLPTHAPTFENGAVTEQKTLLPEYETQDTTAETAFDDENGEPTAEGTTDETVEPGDMTTAENEVVE